MQHHLLTDIGTAVLAATALGLISHWLRQPLILGYLVAGAAIGPQLGLSLIQSADSIETISEIGLVLLLFVVGLEINLKELLSSGRHLLIAGFGQFPLCAMLGCVFFWLIGYPLSGVRIDGLYLALLCGLSSTAIVVKVLFDKRELGTLPGQLTLGVLVIQDVYAIFVLALQPNLASPSFGPVASALISTVVLVGGGFFVSRFILSRIFESIAKTPEMTLAVSLGWCALLAGIADFIGLSKEMGALVAGLCISAFPYSIHVTAKALPLRDFFLTLFFVSLGMKIVTPTWDAVMPVTAIVGFIVLSRFLSIYPLLIASGAGRRAAFICSLNLAQLSEFSLVIASIGKSLGHISDQTLMLAIYSMAVLSVISSYAIRSSHPIYVLFNRIMDKLRSEERHINAKEELGDHAHSIILLGYHQTARAMIDAMKDLDPAALHQIHVIDFNPVALNELRELGVAATFGDLASLDTLRHAHLENAQFVISSIPDMLLRGTDNSQLLKLSKAIAPSAVFVATAHDATHEAKLLREGAGMVVNPFDMSGKSLCQMLGELRNVA